MYVRQYDEEYTKVYNQKQGYEDFNLGLFSELRREVIEGVQLGPGELPRDSDFTQEEVYV